MRLLQGSTPQNNTTTASSHRRGSQVSTASPEQPWITAVACPSTCPSPAAAWLHLASPQLLMKTWLLYALCRSGRRARTSLSQVRSLGTKARRAVHGRRGWLVTSKVIGRVAYPGFGSPQGSPRPDQGSDCQSPRCTHTRTTQAASNKAQKTHTLLSQQGLPIQPLTTQPKSQEHTKRLPSSRAGDARPPRSTNAQPRGVWGQCPTAPAAAQQAHLCPGRTQTNTTSHPI